MRTFSVLAVVGVLLERLEQSGRSSPRPCSMTWMYQVWWLMPAQMMSTSFGDVDVAFVAGFLAVDQQLDDLAICQCPPMTPWQRPTVSTLPYGSAAHVFIALGLA